MTQGARRRETTRDGTVKTRHACAAAEDQMLHWRGLRGGGTGSAAPSIERRVVLCPAPRWRGSFQRVSFRACQRPLQPGALLTSDHCAPPSVERQTSCSERLWSDAPPRTKIAPSHATDCVRSNERAARGAITHRAAEQTAATRAEQQPGAKQNVSRRTRYEGERHARRRGSNCKSPQPSRKGCGGAEAPRAEHASPQRRQRPGGFSRSSIGAPAAARGPHPTTERTRRGGGGGRGAGDPRGAGGG